MEERHKERELLFWIFDQLVNQLEQTEEAERPVQRMEITETGLEIMLKNWDQFQVTVKEKGVPDEENEQSLPVLMERQETIEIPLEDWHAVIDQFEAIHNFLLYDLHKIREIIPYSFPFPWAQREQVIAQLTERLRNVLFTVEQHRK